MRRLSLLSAMILTTLTGRAIAQPHPTPALDALKQSFQAQIAAAESGNLAADLSFYDAQNAQQKKLAGSIAAADVAAARLQKDVAAQFGKPLGDAVAAAAGIETAEQIDAATDKIDGDRATVRFTHPSGVVPMIFAQGRWKVSLTRWLADATPRQVDQLIGTVDSLTHELTHITNLVEHQKFRSGEGVRDRIQDLHDKLFGPAN